RIFPRTRSEVDDNARASAETGPFEAAPQQEVHGGQAAAPGAGRAAPCANAPQPRRPRMAPVDGGLVEARLAFPDGAGVPAHGRGRPRASGGYRGRLPQGRDTERAARTDAGDPPPGGPV